jgi:hypothetical protein
MLMQNNSPEDHALKIEKNDIYLGMQAPNTTKPPSSPDTVSTIFPVVSVMARNGFSPFASLQDSHGPKPKQHQNSFDPYLLHSRFES